MRTEIEWAELHSPLFLSGTNLGMKLDPKKRMGLKMAYDEDKKHLYVTYNGATTRVPEPSILNMVELGDQVTPTIVHEPKVIKRVISAQVSGPQDHVFGGLGNGKTHSK